MSGYTHISDRLAGGLSQEGGLSAPFSGMVDSGNDLPVDEQHADTDDSALETWCGQLDLARFLQINHVEPDDLRELARAAIAHIEHAFGRALVPQRVTAVYVGPSADAYLPRIPAITLESVFQMKEGVKVGNDLKDEYFISAGRLCRKSGNAIEKDAGLEVVYTGGVSALPPEVSLYVKQIAAEFYYNRNPHKVNLDGLRHLIRHD